MDGWREGGREGGKEGGREGGRREGGRKKEEEGGRGRKREDEGGTAREEERKVGHLQRQHHIRDRSAGPCACREAALGGRAEDENGTAWLADPHAHLSKQ